MAKITKILTTLRNNWKKSTFAAVCLSYGYISIKEYYQTQDLMRAYCLKAASYGRQPIPTNVEPKTVTVILNPNANRRKATKNFEKYCAPILHLAGVYVDILQTESEGHAKRLMENLSNTDAIVVAGGDGTLSEVVTGLLRRDDINDSAAVPIGVLPLGRTNTIGTRLFPGGDHLSVVKSLAEAALAVVEEATKPVDVMKIEILEDEDEQRKPTYALCGLRWGAYRDAEAKQDKYWIYGPLRKYATFVFNGYKSSLSWGCEAELSFTAPCEGCSNCRTIVQPQVQKGWFQRFAPQKQVPLQINYSKIINEACSKEINKKLVTSDLEIVSATAKRNADKVPKLFVNIGPESVGYFSFVREGWKSQQGKEREIKERLQARRVKLIPLNATEESRKWFSIDNEDYEAKPVQVTLLPRVIKMFCKKAVDL